MFTARQLIGAQPCQVTILAYNEYNLDQRPWHRLMAQFANLRKQGVTHLALEHPNTETMGPSGLDDIGSEKGNVGGAILAVAARRARLHVVALKSDAAFHLSPIDAMVVHLGRILDERPETQALVPVSWADVDELVTALGSQGRSVRSVAVLGEIQLQWNCVEPDIDRCHLERQVGLWGAARGPVIIERVERTAQAMPFGVDAALHLPRKPMNVDLWTSLTNGDPAVLDAPMSHASLDEIVDSLRECGNPADFVFAGMWARKQGLFPSALDCFENARQRGDVEAGIEWANTALSLAYAGAWNPAEAREIRTQCNQRYREAVRANVVGASEIHAAATNIQFATIGGDSHPGVLERIM